MNARKWFQVLVVGGGALACGDVKSGHVAQPVADAEPNAVLVIDAGVEVPDAGVETRDAGVEFAADAGTEATPDAGPACPDLTSDIPACCIWGGQCCP